MEAREKTLQRRIMQFFAQPFAASQIEQITFDLGYSCNIERELGEGAMPRLLEKATAVTELCFQNACAGPLDKCIGNSGQIRALRFLDCGLSFDMLAGFLKCPNLETLAIESSDNGMSFCVSASVTLSSLSFHKLRSITITSATGSYDHACGDSHSHFLRISCDKKECPLLEEFRYSQTIEQFETMPSYLSLNTGRYNFPNKGLLNLTKEQNLPPKLQKWNVHFNLFKVSTASAVGLEKIREATICEIESLGLKPDKDNGFFISMKIDLKDESDDDCDACLAGDTENCICAGSESERDDV